MGLESRPRQWRVRTVLREKWHARWAQERLYSHLAHFFMRASKVSLDFPYRIGVEGLR